MKSEFIPLDTEISPERNYQEQDIQQPAEKSKVLTFYLLVDILTHCTLLFSGFLIAYVLLFPVLLIFIVWDSQLEQLKQTFISLFETVIEIRGLFTKELELVGEVLLAIYFMIKFFTETEKVTVYGVMFLLWVSEIVLNVFGEGYFNIQGSRFVE